MHDARHPYTLSLIAASSSTTAAAPLQGEIPSPINAPTGCAFHTRCPMARPQCSVTAPALTEISPDHLVACHFSDVSRQTLADLHRRPA